MKKIGIPGWVVDSKVFGVTIPYAEYIRKFGQMIILTPDEPVRDDLDLLFLPGGADISPSRYAGSVSMYTGSSNAHLEYFDQHRLPEYIKNEQPIFGVCRGAQSLYTIFGGMMKQHNYFHHSVFNSEHPKHETHQLFWTKTEYHNKYVKLVDYVNSRHHQSMILDEESTELEAIALACFKYKEGATEKYTDVVEVFKHTSLPIWGTQYHPEDCPNDRFTPTVIRELLEVKDSTKSEKFVETI